MSGPRQDASPFGTGDLWEVLRTPIEVPQVTLPVPAPEVSGGSADPRSAHIVDVTAVVACSARYRDTAAAIRTQERALLATAEEIAVAIRLSTPVDAGVEMVALAARLAVTAHLLGRHVHAREALADRADAAVMLYEDMDARGATAFRHLVVDPTGLLGPSPIGVQRTGWCTQTPPPPDEPVAPTLPGSAPLAGPVDLPMCPGSSPWTVDLADIYDPQDLVLEAPSTAPVTGAPGVAGVVKAIEANSHAVTPEGKKQDAIDVINHRYRGDDGAWHTSYIVAVAGTSRWDVFDVPVDPHRNRTMRPNLEGVDARPSAEARLIPQALAAAGVPPGAEVLLAGHSQGGMTAMSAAALPAMRAYNVQVLTAGSPISRGRIVPSVRYLHIANRGDVVPAADWARNRPLPNQVTVKAGPVRFPIDAHSGKVYAIHAKDIDEAHAEGKLDPRLEGSIRDLVEAGHLRAGTDDAYTVTRFPLRPR